MFFYGSHVSVDGTDDESRKSKTGAPVVDFQNIQNTTSFADSASKQCGVLRGSLPEA